MPGQLRAARPTWLQSPGAEMFGDRLDHQFVFAPVLVRVEQGGGMVVATGGARQCIAAKLPVAQAQQALRRSAEEAVLLVSLPEESAAARLLVAQAFQQQQRVKRGCQADRLAHRQHQFVQFTPVHQLQTALERRGVTPLPVAWGDAAAHGS